SLLLIFFILAAILAWRLSQNLYHDIRKINKGLSQIAKGNHALKPANIRTHEMRQLAENVHQAALAIRHEFDDMRHSVELTTSDLKQTIETIEIQNIELSLAKKSATDASQIKSDFLANTSHEIRTPLNGLIGFTKLLQRTQLNPQQADYVETIQQSSEGLLAIINDILDFSKIEAGKLELDKSPFNLRQVFEDVLTLFAPQAYDKGIEFALMIYQDVPLHLVGDPLRLKQIISNLVSNAIKFTPSGTVAIRVSLESETDSETQLSVTISDTGIGMHQDQQQQLFEAFSQASSSISREYGGTGLGLSIVKNLISQMHGDIHVESKPNQGTTFSFNILLQKADSQHQSDYQPWPNEAVILFETHSLLSLSTRHLLEEFGLKVSCFDQLDAFHHYLSEHSNGIVLYSIKADADINHELAQLERLANYPLQQVLVLTPIHQQIEQFISLHANFQLCLKPLVQQRLQRSLQAVFNEHSDYAMHTEEQSSKLQGINILIADDQPANLKLLHILLRDLGANVAAATNGEEAIQIAHSQAFDIIFMDIQMPIIDGIKATEVIKSESSLNQQTPVVALTANMQLDEKKRLLKTHFAEYLTKPINEEALLQSIVQLCSKAENLAPLPAVDPDLCLKLANFKADLAIDMFDMFFHELTPSLESLGKMLVDNDYHAMQELSHKLHGACCYTGVPQFKQQCQTLENSLKAAASQQQLAQQFQQLQASADAIASWRDAHSLQAALSQLSA
ncbi:MAG: response regulator, partial [Pseudomonadales bacterium]|nr:response regulator [Pseudomonadales bacterium]